jgi:hypothetical protein
MVHAEVPFGADIKGYLGHIVASGEGYTFKLPVSIVATHSEGKLVDFKLKAITKTVEEGGVLKLERTLNDLGIYRPFNVTLTYCIKNTLEGGCLQIATRNLTLDQHDSSFDEIHLDLPGNSTGKYYVEAKAEFFDLSVTATDSFEVIEVFWTEGRVKISIALFLIIIMSASLWYGHKYYKAYLQRNARYLFPVRQDRLPKEGFTVGKIAETSRPAYINPRDLLTHAIVAGATGSGKSVSASIIAEEALENKIPVVVFDPTAQWTGFVKPCQDKDLLARYKAFGLKDPKSFRGMIYEIRDESIKLNLKEYANPGEVTVFDLSKLSVKQYDSVVVSIIKSIFAETWEESTDLKLLVVFDEVHRLLAKYGGEEGYVALEKACREFRKWGIGIIMCSQVTADFKEAVAGNILTEVQMNTKSNEDVERIKSKYGPEYAQRIVKEEVGVGMMQNPRYNEGKPYFVAFRPPLHSPHKILESELREYIRLAEEIGALEEAVSKLPPEKKSDYALELKLAKDKLKTGRFRVTEIYLEGVRKKLGK